MTYLRRSAGVVVSAVALWLVPTQVAAQQAPRCAFVCAPELKIEPAVTVENLFGRPRVETDGRVERTPREHVFELVFALEIPTEIPRVGFTLEAIFVPFGGTSVNPFTGVAAAQIGRSDIRDKGSKSKRNSTWSSSVRIRREGGSPPMSTSWTNSAQPGRHARRACTRTS
jgi:hypothetical protein